MHTKIEQNPNLYPVASGWEFLEIFGAETCLNALTRAVNSKKWIGLAKKKNSSMHKTCLGIINGGTGVRRNKTRYIEYQLRYQNIQLYLNACVEDNITEWRYVWNSHTHTCACVIFWHTQKQLSRLILCLPAGMNTRKEKRRS